MAWNGDPPSRIAPSNPGLNGYLVELGITHALVVTDENTARSGLLEALSAAIPEQFGLTLFKDTPEPPTEVAAREAANLFEVLHCDGIIGLGSRISLTLASVVGLLARDSRPLCQYLSEDGLTIWIPGSASPLLAVPNAELVGNRPMRALVQLCDGRRVRLLGPGLFPHATIALPAWLEGRWLC